MSRPRVGRLHVLTDTAVQTRFGHAELARLAALGGADTVQLREKRAWTTRALVDAAREALAALAGLPRAAALIVDDRVDVCAAANAAGVHLGRHDLPVATARRLLGPHALIGGTANAPDEARALADLPLDYIGVGPVFGTRSKANPAPRLGVAALRRIVTASPHPVIAIGAIEASNVAEVLDAGAWGVAVLSAVVGARDPLAATAALREALVPWLGSAEPVVAAEGREVSS